MSGETGIGNVKFGGFHQAFAKIGRPSRQPVNEKQGFEQDQIAR
jgi:hypothetical protein